MAAPNPSATQGNDFPIVCETCLGPNPYVRMQTHPLGAQCKVCERPFTFFRWRPAGAGTRPKKTELCQTCARAKNVCQVCVLDLKYGLPVQVRDVSMAAGDRQRTVVPKSDGTREYAAAQSERAVANGDIDAIYNAPMVNDIAEKAKRTAPRYERNRSRICTFFLKGTCTRGLYCPYRHEKPDEGTEDGLTDQNLRDRYYGVNDPVASKILQRAGVAVDTNGSIRKGSKRGSGPPPPPDDQTVQTLFIGGVEEGVKENDVRRLFSKQSGVCRLSILASKKIGFVEFDTRKEAEAALSALYGQHEINGARVFVNWGRGNSRAARPVASNTNRLEESAKGGLAATPFVERKESEATRGDLHISRTKKNSESIREQEWQRTAKTPNTKKRASVDVEGGTAMRAQKKSLLTFPSFSDKSLSDKAALPPTNLHSR